LVGEIDVIPYEDVVIVCRKARDDLKPNIYITKEFLSIGETIRGNIIIVNQEKEKFKTLSKEQTVKYMDFLKKASFNYDNISEYDKKLYETIVERTRKEINDSDIKIKNTNDETLKMILGIQTIILKFIKNNMN
jgi:hypothetical protein